MFLVRIVPPPPPLSLSLTHTHTHTHTPQEGSEEGYRSSIFKAIPSLKLLDDLPHSKAEVPTVGGVTKDHALSSRSSLFVLSEAGMERDWQIVQAGIKNQGDKMDELEEGIEEVVQSRGRPSTAPSSR